MNSTNHHHPRLFDRHAARPRPEEGLIQSGGYTHLVQIGSAADLPTLSDSQLWRKASQLQETVGTVAEYLFTKSNDPSGLTEYDEATVTDSKNPTPLAYLGVQQLLAGRIPYNLKMIRNLLSSVGKPMDDRKLQLEDVVGWLATAGKKRHDGPNKLVNDVQGQFISLLWNDLSHPPTVDLNPKHRFRTPDGRDNNIAGFPLFGAANQAYSRSVKPVHQVAPYVAEVEEMFDAILRRPPGYQGFTPHPAGISSLLVAFASIIVHDIFWTNGGSEVLGSGSDINSARHQESKKKESTGSARWQNLTSSYLSLDPLYGVSAAEQETVRDREQLGRGLLYNDSFASQRLLIMPPASCTLLVLFSRNHNRIARKILELNERGTWKKDLSGMSPEQLGQQDDEIFGTARHVNCGYYVGIILHDYLQSILNTVQADSDWMLDPRATVKNLLGSTPKAIGNSVSVEFNLLYRWHAPISWTQTQWIENRISRALPSRRWEDLNGDLFQKSFDILKKELNAQPGSEPKNWKLAKYEVEFTGQGPPELNDQGFYERDPETGKFRDEDLARTLKDSTYEVAGAFGARQVPTVMRWMECQAMRTSRDEWKVCSLNEFRAFLGLKEFETFLEWNADPSVAKAMQDLVGHPSNIPLHVGLHGEEAKEPRLGSGLCPNYTISRAILSDAVALVRGDRFYTDSATADTMTDWGFQDCQSDFRNGAYGGMLEKLIRNNLPDQYAFNDCALLFPFLVPHRSYSYMQGISPQKALDYAFQPPPQPSLGFKQVQRGGETWIYELSDTPKVEIERMRILFGLPRMNSNIKIVYDAVKQVISEQDASPIQVFIRSRIEQCSVKRSPTSCDETVDIARDVCSPLVTGFLAHIFGLVETGLHSQQLLLCALSDIYRYLTESPQITFKLRGAARVAASGLIFQIKYHIQACAAVRSVTGFIKKGASILSVGVLDVLEDSIKTLSGKPSIKHSHADTKAFYKALKAKNDAQTTPLSTEELAADCLRAVATLAYTIVNGTAHALDHLLPSSTVKSEENVKLRETLQSALEKYDANSPHGEEMYLKHALEGARLAHWIPDLRGLVVKTENQERQKDRPIGITDGEFRLDRDPSEYSRLLDVEGNCLPIFAKLVPKMIYEVFSLSKVRRSPGRQGELSKILITGMTASIPTMHLRYDGTRTQKETPKLANKNGNLRGKKANGCI
ncbi:hypothetical protein CROQUDRAFT_56657 [Cronartium quercuum f. sp. fusiforme G11]|uniref:Heme peroxidase n=1 Tax=Cronartium quercuum f. sp. fusiforme G11 TaxID=708437 RepID=A0A9P6NYE5_9BASI|nr:hypothetical protein CROQUDRAFT_56657 [Cronartium quercuum f. sp. fusiforme G11]